MSEPHPEHPIVYPPEVTHPIELPPDIDNEDGEVSQPIELPPEAEDVGDLSFTERKAVQLHWEPTLIGDPWDAASQQGEIVSVCVLDPADGVTKKIRSAKNTGACIVTFPLGFTGAREFKVVGSKGNCDGTWDASA